MLNIFSCIYWPFVHHLWRNIYSSSFLIIRWFVFLLLSSTISLHILDANLIRYMTSKHLLFCQMSFHFPDGILFVVLRLNPGPCSHWSHLSSTWLFEKGFCYLAQAGIELTMYLWLALHSGSTSAGIISIWQHVQQVYNFDEVHLFMLLVLVPFGVICRNHCLIYDHKDLAYF
jgi:hypothetical protein